MDGATTMESALRRGRETAELGAAVALLVAWRTLQAVFRLALLAAVVAVLLAVGLAVGVATAALGDVGEALFGGIEFLTEWREAARRRLR